MNSNTSGIYFRVFKSTHNGQWYFSIRSSGNHAVIAQSEGYIQRSDAYHAIGLIRSGAAKGGTYDDSTKAWAA